MFSNDHIQKLRKGLLSWHATIDRRLPWKETRDPYKIWVSEIILQQTRVDHGIDYYRKFVTRFPDVFSLAKSTEDEVLSVWKGLGYYSRARNMHFSAMEIVEKYNGEFPKDYQKIIQLKGIGSYTASAITSFAFDQPYAVLDGNVFRVLSRFFSITTPIDSTEGKKLFGNLSLQCLEKKEPAAYNQAIMDFGALICTPARPACVTCPISRECQGRKNHKTLDLPVKRKKIQRKNRYFHYFLVRKRNEIAVVKRTESDIWKGLYELPRKMTQESALIECSGQRQYVESRTQILTHLNVHAKFYVSEKNEDHKDLIWLPITKISQTPFPKVINDFLLKYFNLLT